MFIAHAPFGYLLTRAIGGRAALESPGLIATGLIASVAPDFDLAWFFTLGQRAVPHHAYPTHWPLVWLALGAVAWVVMRLAGWRRGPLYVAVATAGLIGHMALDTVAGGILWLAPFDWTYTTLAHIPARGGWWVWNFVLHWTFAIEIAITLIALAMVWRDWHRVRRRVRRLT